MMPGGPGPTNDSTAYSLWPTACCRGPAGEHAILRCTGDLLAEVKRLVAAKSAEPTTAELDAVKVRERFRDTA
jgi:hypothetical protein